MINETTPIWRYMNLYPFLSQLVRKQFSFTQLQYLEDLTEGRMKDIAIFEKIVFVEENQSKSEESKKKIISKSPRNKGKYYVSCWTQADEENYALWKIFTNQIGGVAIRTTVKKFMDCFPESLEIEPKPINYKSHSKRKLAPSTNNIDDCVFSKFDFYKYEGEFRFAITRSKKSNSNYLNIPINFSSMIDRLYMSPYMNDSNIELFEKTIKVLDIEIFNKIQKSKIQLK